MHVFTLSYTITFYIMNIYLVRIKCDVHKRNIAIDCLQLQLFKSNYNQMETNLYYKIKHSILIVLLQFHCALVAAAVFAAAFSCHITSFENAEAVTCSLPRQNTNNFNCFWVKYTYIHTDLRIDNTFLSFFTKV